ncbi:hypothetical protein [Verrucomicrobium sp. BvORR034]|uniref:hypothetical protein n=1 Tax=Verrucomicrobium sp. BvORR034 TaxID=1396418 RepID=UPI002240F725|nr:hypothetical protein [Verrucomicrobium sp. BvORR034]
MKPFLIASFLYALALAAAAAAPLSPEAKADFEWFNSLGYPELKEANWVQVWIPDGTNIGSEPSKGNYFPAFVIGRKDLGQKSAPLQIRQHQGQAHSYRQQTAQRLVAGGPGEG